MALTQSEAKVLAALEALTITEALTVTELCRQTGLGETPIRTALLRLTRDGLAVQHSGSSPARWRPTDRGRIAIRRPSHRRYHKADRS